MKKTKSIIYAFIDSQNLNLGVKSLGWNLDWKKFRQYLKNKFNVEKAFLFIGYKPGNEKLYTAMQECGYIIVFKPTLELPDGAVKGNVDAELVLHAMIEYKNYQKAIIVSSDGDFFCLIEYLGQKNKLLRIVTPNKSYSRLFKPFAKFILQINWLKGSLKQKRLASAVGRNLRPIQSS